MVNLLMLCGPMAAPVVVERHVFSALRLLGASASNCVVEVRAQKYRAVNRAFCVRQGQTDPE